MLDAWHATVKINPQIQLKIRLSIKRKVLWKEVVWRWGISIDTEW